MVSCVEFVLSLFVPHLSLRTCSCFFSACLASIVNFIINNTKTGSKSNPSKCGLWIARTKFIIRLNLQSKTRSKRKETITKLNLSLFGSLITLRCGTKGKWSVTVYIITRLQVISAPTSLLHSQIIHYDKRGKYKHTVSCTWLIKGTD